LPTSAGCSLRARSRLWLPLILLICIFGRLSRAEVAAVSLQSPSLSAGQTTNLTSPIHVEATAEDTLTITGYVVYVDYENVYQNFSTSLDAWITLPAGSHTIFVKAWDSESDLATAVYSINISGFAPPTPPANASHAVNLDQETWTVDNNPGVGGNCNDGSIGTFLRRADPNTANMPVVAAAHAALNADGSSGEIRADGSGGAIRAEAVYRLPPLPAGGFAPAPSGQLFIVNSHCTYDDSLFYLKIDTNASDFSAATNFLWDFRFYVPDTTKASTVQAIEADLFQAVELSDGVHEFMFGSQCNYATNQWQIWLPQDGALTWVDAGISPCRFSSGAWHHATYFLQRVTPSGYQEIPNSFSPSTDDNSSLRFGTLTIDGATAYLGGVSPSTIPSPAWSAVLGVQHQLDSAVAGVTIEEYLVGESLTYW
jgi:hypothetical protein